MLGFAVIAVAIVVTGTAALAASWKEHDLRAAELITGGAIVGLGAWLAIHWALAIGHALTRTAVAIVAGAFVIAAVAIAIRHARRAHAAEVPREVAIALAFLLPLLCWVVFILWRGTVLPPLNHDALAYHLPKAVLMMRAHGYEQFSAPDARVGGLPANYELLLADVLILSGNDRVTEWIGTATFILFAIAAAALARRWGSGIAGATAASLAAASAPVVLLHSGADKNDLLVAWTAVAALLFGSMWCVRGGRVSAAVAMLAAVIGTGTKPNMGAVVLALAPFALWRIGRSIRTGSIRAKDVALTAAFALGAVLLCGGWSYIASWLATGGTAPSAGGPRVAPALTVGYGDWFNLWQFPWLLLTIPFSSSQHGVWVPWAGEHWFWPHYELFWSHYGFLFPIAVLLLPLAVWRYRSGRAAERRIATAAGAMAIAIMLPAVARPIGFYGTYPRYLLLIVPVVYAWTLAPLADELWQRRRAVSYALLGALAFVFCWYAVLCAEKDRFAPLEFVQWAARHPGTRWIAFMGNRAASVVDRRAGPHDTIAVDGTFETWIYPAYGASLTRPVVFLPPLATPADVPAEADWVIVDRSWNTIWASTMRDMGDGWKQLSKGTAPPGDLRFYELLRKDPRFQLVYRSDRFNQAVFRRVGR